MKTFELKELTAKAEFGLLKVMYEDYIKAPQSFIGVEIKTPTGTFVNKGGFNGNLSDLWLVKKGTKGETKKTFWRTSFGSKKSGFGVFVYDLRFKEVTKDNVLEVANEIGATVKGEGDGIKYFI